jgi:hypothetical protein
MTVTVLLSLVAMTVGSVVGLSSPASAASCTYPRFQYFPGSSLPPYLRYGEVDFSFEACGDAIGSSTAQVAAQGTNATGDNLGFFLNGVSIVPNGSGSYYKDFIGVIGAKTCTPRVGWPCSRSYSFSVQFRVTSDRFGNPQVYENSRSSSDPGLTLYTTP